MATYSQALAAQIATTQMAVLTLSVQMAQSLVAQALLQVLWLAQVRQVLLI